MKVDNIFILFTYQPHVKRPLLRQKLQHPPSPRPHVLRNPIPTHPHLHAKNHPSLQVPLSLPKDASSEEKSNSPSTKTEAVRKTTSTTFTCTDKSSCPCLTSVNQQHCSSKPWKCSNKEWGTTWTLLSCSTPAGRIQRLQGSILSTTTLTWATTLSDTTTAGKWPEPPSKAHTFIIRTFHTMVTSGTSPHPWSTMMRSTPRISRSNDPTDRNQYQYLTY